jgi:lysophospholipase L1-like esterase
VRIRPGRLLVAALLAAGVAAAPAPVPDTTATPAPIPLRIMPLGDSITLGLTSRTFSGYRDDLCRRLTAAGLDVDLVGSVASGTGPDIDHEGHPGWTIAQIAAMADAWLAAAAPDVVTVKKRKIVRTRWVTVWVSR